MSESDRGPVVVDTGVFSARLGRRDNRLTTEITRQTAGQAATAIRLGVPLVAHDAIFVGVDGLTLISTL